MNKMTELIEALDRAKTLLKATQEILQQCADSPIVLNTLEIMTTWDGCECDGSCLKEDIEQWLDLYADEEGEGNGCE